MNKFFEKLSSRLSYFFNLSSYLVTQQEAEASIREGVSFRGTNIIILIMAIFIASLGLNTNSTAVIIGAMLISPLMGPIIGMGLAVGIQDFPLLKRSMRNLAMATLFSIATSTLFFLISPVGQGHSELLARTSPTIYDVLIGFFGGGAGIVAIGSRSKGNVIPGVAIATALMPPLCTVGYGLATWQIQYFLGALYLYLINSVFICVATFIGVKLMQFKPTPTQDIARARKVKRIIYATVIIVLLPSIYLTYNMIRQSRFELNAQKFVQEQCNFPNTHVLSSKAVWHTKGKRLTLTLIGDPLPTDSLVLALSSHLKAYNLQGTEISIVQGSSLVPKTATEDASLSDIYKISQAALASKQETIDSLSDLIAQTRRTENISSQIMPELKVIFPQVSDIAISSALLAQADTTKIDTLNVALVRLRTPLPAAKRRELTKYLEARLSLPHISVINL